MTRIASIPPKNEIDDFDLKLSALLNRATIYSQRHHQKPEERFAWSAVVKKLEDARKLVGVIKP